MTDGEKMTIYERRKYLRRMQKRYQKADRKEQVRLLDDMVLVTDLHRKGLIRLTSGTLERTPQRRQQDRTYSRRWMTPCGFLPRLRTTSALND